MRTEDRRQKSVISGQWLVVAVFIFFSLFTVHCSLFTVFTADAFSIGAIEVKSSFNEGFKAEIPVYVDGQGGLEVSIGNGDDYARLGIKRHNIVDSLTLNVESVDKDKAIVRISSTKPINQPSFNLIIKAVQNGGTILENYFLAIDFQKSLSLNLPSADENAKTEENIIPPTPPLLKGGEGGLVEEIIQKPAITASGETNSEEQAPAVIPQPEIKSITAKSGDTLYRIANRLESMAKESVKQAHGALEQIVVAIWKKNRNKFINQNMNELEKNTVLEIENIKALASSIPVSEAKRTILEQWREWNSRKREAGVNKIDVAEASNETRSPELPIQIESLTAGDAIRQRIIEWKKDWETKDLEKYMSHYASKFISGGYNLTSWKEYKNRFNKRHNNIEISIDNIQIRREGNLLIASFLQRFKSDKMKSAGIKTLYFKDENGEWRIKGEDWNKYIQKDNQAKHPYVIHISSFRDRGTALKEVNYFRKKGYSAYDVPFKLSDKGVWYRVLIDRFSSKAEVKEFAKAIIKDGHADYVKELELPYSIETGIFESYEEAVNELLRLKEMGYSPYPLMICSSDKCSYQILIGAYNNSNSANPISEELISKGIQNKLVQP